MPFPPNDENDTPTARKLLCALNTFFLIRVWCVAKEVDDFLSFRSCLNKFAVARVEGKNSDAAR